jgi:hypothetical protein
MRHFLYNMRADAPAPVGMGDTETWFKYYKLEDGGETFVPLTEAYDTLEGDLLWFSMDSVIIGYAPVLRQVEDEANNRWELWFDSTKYVDATECRAGVPEWGTMIPEEQARLWLDRLAGKKP